jgi:hypothetical protein
MNTEARMLDALSLEQHEPAANAATKEEPPESLARAA